VEVSHREDEARQVFADEVLQAELGFEDLVQVSFHRSLRQPRLDVLDVDHHLRVEEFSDQFVHVDESHPLLLGQELLFQFEWFLSCECVGVDSPRSR